MSIWAHLVMDLIITAAMTDVLLWMGWSITHEDPRKLHGHCRVCGVRIRTVERAFKRGGRAAFDYGHKCKGGKTP